MQTLLSLLLACGSIGASASSIRNLGKLRRNQDTWNWPFGNVGSDNNAVVVQPTAATTTGLPMAPYSGAPFMVSTPLEEQPSWREDGGNPEMLVSRIRKVRSSQYEDTASAHACDMGDQADKNKCLHVDGRNCMWTRVESRDPLKRFQASNSYCLPCRLDGLAMPCWNVGAWVDGKQVTDCEMSCDHQEKLMQKNYACSDDTGFISQMQCFSRGSMTGSKCMFMAYEVNGETKTSCAPCEVAGTGTWGCPADGEEGPVAGSKVKNCLSQCDVLCTGPPACPPTVAPPPPPPPPAPGIYHSDISADTMVSAPIAMALPTVNPWSIIQAAHDAAFKASGFMPPTTLSPKTYYPVVYYRSPVDYMFTTGPPPIAGPEPPLPEPVSEPSSLASAFGSESVFVQTGHKPEGGSQGGSGTPLRRLRQKAPKV